MGLGQATGITISQPAGGAGGGGTVTSVTAGNAAPLFTTTVATGTTTPAVSFAVSSAPGNSVLGNTGSTAATPAYTSNPSVLTLTANSVTAPTFTGALLGNANTATTATTANNLPGGLLGAIPYQSAAGTTTLLNGSTSSATAVLVQTGNGTTSAAPGWNAITGTPGFAVFSISPTFTGTVTTAALSSTTVNAARLRSTGSAPTIAAGAAAGTGATAVVLAGSTNVSGQITITTAGVPATGTLATITFNGAALSPAPLAVFLMPASGAAATAVVSVCTTIPSTTAWTITTPTTPVATTATLTYFYWVV